MKKWKFEIVDWKLEIVNWADTAKPPPKFQISNQQLTISNSEERYEHCHNLRRGVGFGVDIGDKFVRDRCRAGFDTTRGLGATAGRVGRAGELADNRHRGVLLRN
jgi:hypothetical protein